MSEPIEFRHVESGPELENVRGLFLEYARSLDFELCFQSFDDELRKLPGVYARPGGRLILCSIDGTSAGCIALKPLQPEICEMKRLFVRPDFRGRALGRQLAEYVIEEARHIGYSAMRLDTIGGKMDQAIGLYRSLGFREIPRYYENPIPNAIYFELLLNM